MSNLKNVMHGGSVVLHVLPSGIYRFEENYRGNLYSYETADIADYLQIEKRVTIIVVWKNHKSKSIKL